MFQTLFETFISKFRVTGQFFLIYFFLGLILTLVILPPHLHFILIY